MECLPKKLEIMRKFISSFFLLPIYLCFWLGPLPANALDDFTVNESHSFVANVASKVSPSVVRIDIEREVETDEFAKVELLPKFEGRQMVMVLAPK